MNYLIEGLQGSGKSTLVQKLSEIHSECRAIREGDYSPVELAWCALLDESKYKEILEKYPEIREEIEAKTVAENDRYIVSYTQILTDIPGFHKDLEQYEIYNGRTTLELFKEIVLERYRNWNTDNNIFECSIFQNTVEDMILFREMDDEEIISFYREVREALGQKNYRIIYLKTDDIAANIMHIREERSDANGNELWYPLMMEYFNNCPWAISNNKRDFDGLVEHLRHRQELELKICEDVFEGRCTVLESKGYKDADLRLLSLRRETQHFTMFYDEQDSSIINRIAESVDNTYDSIIRRFELSYDWDKFRFMLCPDVQSFKEMTGKSDEEYQTWMVGNADYKKRMLCILSPNAVTDRSFEDMLSVVRHEVVHIAFDQLESAEEANIFIAEGIAVAMADQIMPDLLDVNDYPEAAKLSDEEYFYDNDGYTYSGVYVLYLLKKYGTEVFRNIYAGREPIEKYLYEGFEREAVLSFIG